MNTLLIENKKYIVIEALEYEKFQEKAARKTTPVRKLTLERGKKYAYQLIDKWSKEK